MTPTGDPLALETLTDVRVADVYKAGRRAAQLTRTPDGVTFRYLPDYDGAAVATTLPRPAEPLTRPGGALPAYFAGLLPEGRRLGALRRVVKTSLDDELSLLLAVGVDTIGDVAVVPHGTHPAEQLPRVVLDPDAPLRFADLLCDLDLHPDRHGIPGVQDKASAVMINVPALRAGTSLIMKFEPPEYPGLAGNEAVMLRAATLHGLRTPDAQVVHDIDGAAALVVVRFDRTTRPAGVHHSAVEDGCQVAGLAPGDKYTVGYPTALGALAAVCDARALALRTLLEQLVFAILTGNGDAHAKNFSILQQPDGEWQVSPAYDVPTSQPYGDTTLAIPVNGRRSDVGAADVLSLGREVGLPERATRRVLREATDRVTAWLPLLEELPYDSGKIQKLKRVVTQRRGRLAPP